MPAIEVQHVVSFSSADKNNPAENLLKVDGSHKWRCATQGEKMVTCILQFTKCSQIHSIDIGNEGSAFVEILVGKSAAYNDTDFEVLLVASSFMSPLDSRNGTNRTSVRMFGPEKLNKTTACQMWDRVKIVCTQPFAKTSQYGLSFIKFHSPPSTTKEADIQIKKLGAFTLKAASDDEETDLQAGRLFAKRSQIDDSPSSSGLTTHRTRLVDPHIKTTVPASTSSSSASTKPDFSSKKAPESQKRKATSLVPQQTAKKKTVRESPPDTGSDTEEESKEATKPPLRKQSTSISSTASGDATLKRSKTVPSSKSPAQEFSHLMKSVVFVLSGFQNPYRADLRDKALEMGAKYRPDWGKGCTHLICAFNNTPKYKQVAGKGKIVTKSWIMDSYKMNKLLPWRKYRLGDAESPDESSDDEDDDDNRSKTHIVTGAKPEQKATPTHSKKETPKKDAPPSRGALPKKGVAFDSDSDSGEDTDDQIRKATEKIEKNKEDKPHAPKSPSNTTGGNIDPYDAATDEEIASDNAEDAGSDSGLPELPDFFTDKHFFFYGEFETSERRLLTRYVAAYNGEEEDYMSKKVNYVVTAQKWDDNFEQALSENSSLVFVKPKWILACHEKNKLLPYQPYIVVPQ